MEWLKTITETLTLLAVIYYAHVARGQLNAMIDLNKITRDSSNLEHRPYIGVSSVEAANLFVGPDGATMTSARPNKKTVALEFAVIIKNFGPIPGTNYSSHIRTFYGNSEIPKPKFQTRP